MEGEQYPLHRSVFEGNIEKVEKLLEHCDIAAKDKHGNTALHIAVMMGNKAMISVLLSNDAPVRTKNSGGWNVLAEGISLGDRPTLRRLVSTAKQQSGAAVCARKKLVSESLSQLGDFTMSLKWDFESWVPLVSRILPCDVCRIRKKGTRIRLDTTLVDFKNMGWERGDISFLVGTDADFRGFIVLDNVLKVYQRIRKTEETTNDIEEELDIMMSSDIVAANSSMKDVTFAPEQTGWIFRGDKTELVGRYPAQVYSLLGFNVTSLKRREHLSEDDLVKNRGVVEGVLKGGQPPAPTPADHRPSLPAPPPCSSTWDQYISAALGKPAVLGRPHKSKRSTRNFRASVAMSEEFPLTIATLMPLLEVVSPIKHFSKLRDFVKLKLPPGFPVKVDIPILPTVSAKVTFQDFEFVDNVAEDLFKIPEHYTLDEKRFAEL